MTSTRAAAEVASKQPDDGAIQVERVKARQVIIVAIITAVSAAVGALIQGAFAAGGIDRLKSQMVDSAAKVKGLQQDLDGPQASSVERDALYRITAERLDSDLRLTSQKTNAVSLAGLSEGELNYRRIRRAAFLNMNLLRANSAILAGTLDTLIGQGLQWITPQRSRILSEFKDLRTVRLRWLEDKAIPELQRATDAARTQFSNQSLPSVSVELPQEVWILDHSSDEKPKLMLTDVAALNDEVDLLKRSM